MNTAWKVMDHIMVALATIVTSFGVALVALALYEVLS